MKSEGQVKTQRGADHLQGQDRGLGSILPSRLSEEASFTNTLISDFQPLEVSEN